jgi:hypothetical protein
MAPEREAKNINKLNEKLIKSSENFLKNFVTQKKVLFKKSLFDGLTPWRILG